MVSSSCDSVVLPPGSGAGGGRSGPGIPFLPPLPFLDCKEPGQSTGCRGSLSPVALYPFAASKTGVDHPLLVQAEEWQVCLEASENQIEGVATSESSSSKGMLGFSPKVNGSLLTGVKP
ncbi:hypothetical protein PM082_009551 [Marasmius tenuissimus]|nr:hypothetical protein PM082_009551 [Marasmius tenuissimus]